MTAKCIIFLTLLTFSSCDERNNFDRNLSSSIPTEIAVENTNTIVTEYSIDTTTIVPTIVPIDVSTNESMTQESIISLIKNLESLRENTISNFSETSNRIEVIGSQIDDVSNDFDSKINDTNKQIAELRHVISGIEDRTNVTVMGIESRMKSFNESIQSLEDFQMNITKNIQLIESKFDERINSVVSVSEMLEKNISDLSNQQEKMAKCVEILDEKVYRLLNQTKSFELKLDTIRNELYQELFQDIVKELEKMFEKSVMSYKTMFKQMNQTFIKHSDRVNSRYNSFTIPVIVFTVLLIVVNLVSIFYAQKFNNQIAMKENARKKKRIGFEPVAIGHNVVNHPGHQRVGIKLSGMEKLKGNKRVSFKPLIEMVHSRDEQSDSMIQLIEMTSKRRNGKGEENEGMKKNSSNDDCITFQEMDLNGTSKEEDGTVFDSISCP